MRNTIAISLKNRFRNILLFLLFSGALLLITDSRAENAELPQADNNRATLKATTWPLSPRHKPSRNDLQSEEQSSHEEVVFNKLNTIIDNINVLKKELEDKTILLNKAKTEKEKTTILNEIDEINQLIKEQENAFEVIQTGGLDLAKVEDSQDKSFDWQKNLLEILQPIMNELHQYTEDKRKVVQLQNKIAFYQSQIKDSNKALEKMARIDKAGLEQAALDRFEKVRKKWKNLLEDSKHKLGVVKMRLDGMIAAESEKEVSIGDHIQQFVLGRGATILMAVLAAVVVFFSMSLVWSAIMWLSTRNQNGKLSYFQRITHLVYRTMMVLFSIATIFFVLNQRNDQVLVGVAVLLLIVVIWALKNSVPRYMNELQTILNAGPVREGERVLYNGVPMKIDRLNFFSRLTNPAMPELKVRLPLSELNSYVSRPYKDDEPWFPCKEGDFVLLSNGWCLKVKCITPEHVLLTLGNGAMPQIYTIEDFMEAGPKNLSEGFIVVSVIGIDYKYQQRCTTDIPGIFREGIRKGLLQEGYGHALKDLLVYFNQANSSSLDYKIIAVLDGNAAANYNDIVRDLQRFAVDVCNQQQWNIPFNQMVVHQAEN
ncbi:MAG TPA: hypothetical protein PKM20_09080 [Nitrosomonas sp.]|nr:hypothetical protein [Nitrosomonas sp.]HNP26880.1 hypothetical protein [Nitrosomonas sp.]